jgi:type IV secretory pathway VirJ component
MKLNLSNPFDKNKAIVYFNKLIEKKAKIELSEINQARSLSANAYMHVCIALMSIEWGNTLDEQKTDLKRACNFMHYEKNGKRYLKRTRDLDSRECVEFIEFIRNYAAIQGLYIPTSEEYLYNKFDIDREIERNKQYL